MNWDWEVYHRQPVPFLEAIDLFRKVEAEEEQRLRKK